MENITYVTGNKGKYISVKDHFLEKNMELSFYEYDFEEPEVNDIEKISHEKALKAYEIVKGPCFVSDSGFYIDHYPNNPGYPGAFVKRSGIASNVDSLLETMKGETNRSCKFLDCLTFYDGEEFYTFFGESSGTLSSSKKGENAKRAKSNLWYVFIPNHSDKTLAEMTDDEIKKLDDRKNSVVEKFSDWYKNIYLKQQKNSPR